MPHDGQTMTPSAALTNLTALTEAALPEVEALLERARENVRADVSEAGKL